MQQQTVTTFQEKKNKFKKKTKDKFHCWWHFVWWHFVRGILSGTPINGTTATKNTLHEHSVL